MSLSLPAPIAAFPTTPPPFRLLPLRPPPGRSPPATRQGRGGGRDERCSTAPRSSRRSRPSIHQDEEGRCVFGKKEYWDAIYAGEDDGDDGGDGGGLPPVVPAASRRPAAAYSWYCGWSELRPFWTTLVPSRARRVVVAGVGNDPTPAMMHDDGYSDMLAYDYSRRGVERARALFGGRDVELIVADATDLPLETASVDATLDKGTLDAIYITGKDVFRDAVREMGRVTAPGGVAVSVSSVVEPDELLGAFDGALWENVHDGGLAFAEDGEATIDLGADLYSWRRTDAPF